VEEHTPAPPPGAAFIDGYAPGGFTVGGVRHAGSILVLPNGVAAWAVTSPESIDEASLAPLRDASPPVELVILGTGSSSWLVPPRLRAEVRSWGIIIEAMSTPSACRTFNILLADRRQVAAALLALHS
jgi:uncharacterized protein